MIRRQLAVWALVVSALDLSTSLSLHGADRQIALPERPTWLLCVQLALLPVLGLCGLRAWPALRRGFDALPGTRAAKLTVALVAAVQLAHVGFRTEHYPFSAVTMFSDYVPPDSAASTTHAVFLVDGRAGPQTVSFLREGNPYFSEYLTLDYKAGWVFGTFAQFDSESVARVSTMLATAGAVNPRLARVQVDAHDGALRVLSEQKLVAQHQSLVR